MLKWLTVEEFLSSLYCYAQLSEVIDYGIISRICSELEFFKTKTKNIKTVATFYRRMYNGGAENVVAKLVNLWVENGYNVVLFTNEEPNKDDYYISPEVKRVILPAIAWQDVDSFENRCRVLRENLEKYSVDVMVYHSWNDYGKSWRLQGS